MGNDRSVSDGLTSLTSAFSQYKGKEISIRDTVLSVRQISIGHGCLNRCSHCFANAPARIEQMGLASFHRLAKEFGYTARSLGLDYPFLFLGASTDPSMIDEFANYLEIWIRSMPDWHKVRFYTHGWLPSSKSQCKEIEMLLAVIKSNRERIATVNLSIDKFSRLAKEDWTQYQETLAFNLKQFMSVLPVSAIRLHIIYPPGIQRVPPLFGIEHWQSRALPESNFPSALEIAQQLKQARSRKEKVCRDLTTLIFRIGEKAGLSGSVTASICRYGGEPVGAGRARSSFKARGSVELGRVLNRYGEKDLRLLADLPYKNESIIIMPSGTARVVNYLGYKVGPWLDGGKKIFHYVSSSIRKDSPWS